VCAQNGHIGFPKQIYISYLKGSLRTWRLGELLPARHGLSEIERTRRVDTVPFAVLYLEAMETAKTPLASFPSIGHPQQLGAPVRLFPQGRVAAVVRPGYGYVRHRGSLAGTRGHMPFLEYHLALKYGRAPEKG